MESSSTPEELSLEESLLSSSSIFGTIEFWECIGPNAPAFESFIFSHASNITDLQILITLVHMLCTFCIFNFSRALNNSVCPPSFEKFILSLLIVWESNFFVIPNTNSQGARWGQYWGSPKISIPKSFHRLLHLLVRWIEALSNQIVIILDSLLKHLLM